MKQIPTKDIIGSVSPDRKTLNVVEVLKLANFMEELPSKDFDMQQWGAKKPGKFGETDTNVCRTPACMAGWVVRNHGKHLYSNLEITMHATSILGLSPVQAGDLFEPFFMQLSYINKDEAAKVLRNLAETGEVDWSIAASPEKFDPDYPFIEI